MQSIIIQTELQSIYELSNPIGCNNVDKLIVIDYLVWSIITQNVDSWNLKHQAELPTNLDGYQNICFGIFLTIETNLSINQLSEK